MIILEVTVNLAFSGFDQSDFSCEINLIYDKKCKNNRCMIEHWQPLL